MFLKSFDTKANFWILNPQIAIHAEPSILYEADTSKNKTDSSKIMWAICLLCDPSDENTYRNYPDKDREKLIINDYLKDKEFTFARYEDIIRWYKEVILTPAERSLINWKNKLEERDEFLFSTNYSLETGDALDKLLANTDKLYNQYERVAKQYLQEKLEEQEQGGKMASLTDRNII